jgi:hypothetical protein
MRLLTFLLLITVVLSGCETATSPGAHAPASSYRATPSAHQNQNPNVTAGKMMSPLM